MSSQFLVVGVGASAGGIEALQAFFSHVPADSGCAYVVILHLSPEYESNLAGILQNVTPLPVTVIRERTLVEPNHVYVVSPSQQLTMVDGFIAVAPTTSPAERRAPIDLFFRTLADSHDGRGVCVVLSGSGSDGSLGLKQVKERGGAVFVQQPDEAAFAEMPRSAIATDLVDAVLPVAEIPARIVAYAANNSRVTIPEEGELLPATQEQALRELVALLRARTGHDFSQYKRPTLFRRIERRIAVHTLPDLPAYVAFLRDHPEETQALLKDLLISVTTFFRDPEAFAALEREVLPKLLAERGPDDQLRLWVAGCATGEEAYSLAMLCAEHTEGLLDPPRVQIFATDIDEGAIARARSGVYSAADTADISPERLRRFFIEEQGRYRVRPELRELVLFASHNLLTDPPFSQLDLVSCRNLLIYLDRGAQERVLETFHFALKEDGVLLLGNAETADSSAGLFAPISREQRLYQRRTTGLRAVPPLVTGVIPRSDPPIALVAAEEQERVRERLRSSELHRLLLEQYAPPSLVVTTDYALVHLSERAGRYLQLTGGEPTNDLLALIRPELRVALRTALFQAVQQQAPIEVPNLSVRVEERTEQLTLRVRPVLRPDTPSRGFLLVLFEPELQAGAPRSSSASVLSADEQVLRQLEEEAQRLRQQLRFSAEQYEVQTEELKAANEELQALNEELRTAGEEQTTSREELQSVNEELRTLNQELKVKVEETTHASANLHNLVNATNIATIFLDRKLRVQLFTPAARSLFNLIPLDQGRALADITHRLQDVNVLADAEQVFATLQTVEREVQAIDGRVYILRVLPYRIGDDRIGGVVLTFFDITERVRAETSLRESEKRLQLVLGASGMGTFRYHIAEDRGEPDARMLALFGLPEHGTLNLAEALTTLIHPDDRGRYAEDVARATNPAGDGLLQSDIRVLQLDGSVRWVAVSAQVLFEGEPRRATLMYGVASDISERKQAEARQALLLTLSDTIRPLREPKEIQATVTRTALEHFHADRCYYCEIEHGSAVIRQDSARGSLPSVVGAYPVDSQPLFKAVIDAGRPFAVQDTFTTDLLDEPLRQTCIHLQIISFINVPVIKDGQPVGILAVTQCTQRQWTAFDMELAVEVAERTWAAVERARTEEALRVSEEKYRTLFDSIDEGFAIVEVVFDANETSVDYRFLEINRAFERQTGIEDAAGRLMREIEPRHEAHWFEIYGRIAQTGEPARFEAQAAFLSQRWFDVYAFRVGTPEQRRVAILFTDISERKRAEEALRASEERQAFLLKLSDILRPLSDAAEIQGAAARVLGEHLDVTRAMYAEVEGEPGAEVGTLRGQYHAAEQSSPAGTPVPPFPERYDYAAYGEQMMALRRRGETMVVADVTMDPRFDAAERAAWVAGGVRAAVTVPLVKAGRFVVDFGVQSAVPRAWNVVEVALVEETAERTWAVVERARAEEAMRESEARLRSLFDTINQGVAIMELVRDDAGTVVNARYLELNPAFETLTGFPRSAAEGRQVSEVFPQYFLDFQPRLATVEGPTGPERAEGYIPETGRWFSFYAAPFGGGDGFVIYFDNITERKRREANLAFLAETNEHFALLQSPSEMMEHLGERLARYLNLSRFVFSEVDDEADRITAVSEWRRDAETPSALGSYQISALLTEAGRRQYAAGTLTVIPDTRDTWVLAAPPELLYESGNVSIVDAPYHENGRWKFLLTAVRSEPGEWRTDEIELLRELTMRIGTQVERARAQAALRESEHRLRAMAEHLPGGAAFIVDRDLRYLLAEGEALRAAGFEPQEVIGKTIVEVLEPELAATHEPYYGMALAGDAFQLEHTAHGTSFITRGTPLRNARGEVYAVLAVSYDISARKRAEEALRESEARFRTLTDAVPQVIWTNDPQGNATYFNERWYTYSGLSEEQSAGLGWQVIVHPDDAPASFDRWQQALAAGEVFETEYRLRGVDGSYRWHLGRTVPLRDEGGAIIGWFGSATDIEELKLAEAARYESATLRRLAVAQEEERLRIARDLHDQLGQQITGLLLGLKQLEEPVRDTPAAALLASLQELALDLAKESHRIAVNLRPTALEDVGLVAALEQLVASWGTQSEVAAAFAYQGTRRDRLPRSIEVALYRVAQEALTNVQKHAQATTVSVILEWRREQVALILEDNGQGFDPDAAQGVTERPGLGLLGMHERVTKVGGILEVESSLGSGTTLLVRIPLQTDEPR